MNLNDVHRGIHKNKSAKAHRPRPRLRPRQDRRPRAQGPRLPRRLFLVAGLRGRADAPGPPHPQARLPQPLRPRRGHRQPRRSGREIRSRRGSQPRNAQSQIAAKGGYDVLKVLGNGELTKKPEDLGPPVQPLGAGEDREGRRTGRRAAGQGPCDKKIKQKPPIKTTLIRILRAAIGTARARMRSMVGRDRHGRLIGNGL